MQEWQEFIQQIAAAAEAADDASLAALARAASRDAQLQNLRVLVTGRAGCGGWDVATEMADAGQPWRGQPCDRFPVVDLSGAPNDCAVFEYAAGLREQALPSRIREAAGKFDKLDDTAESLPKRLEIIFRPGEGPNIDVRWARLDTDRTDDQWRLLLTGV